MADIGFGKPAFAGRAAAGWINGGKIMGILGVSKVDPALFGKGGAGAAHAGLHDAVEHIHPAQHAFQQAIRAAHAH